MARSKKLTAPVTLLAAIEQGQHEALRQLAFSQRRSLAEVTRDARSEYLERHAPPRRRVAAKGGAAR